MTQDAKKVAYRSFLLRCWLMRPASGEQAARWRFVLREVTVEQPEEQRFGSLEEVLEFLQGALEQSKDDKIE